MSRSSCSIPLQKRRRISRFCALFSTENPACLHNIHHSKGKMADSGKQSRRTEGFHIFRDWHPKTWLGNTKITEAFVYQLCCGYRTIKSRRQLVKISTKFVFLPGCSIELYFQIFFWFFSLVENGGLTLLEMNDCACSLRGRLLGLFWRIRELVWIANRLCSSIPYYFSIVKTWRG